MKKNINVKTKYVFSNSDKFLKFFRPIFDFKITEQKPVLIHKIYGKLFLKANSDLAQALIAFFQVEKEISDYNNKIFTSYDEIFKLCISKKHLASYILKAVNFQKVVIPVDWGSDEFNILINSPLVIIFDGGTPQTRQYTEFGCDLNFVYSVLDINNNEISASNKDYNNSIFGIGQEVCWGFEGGCQISTMSTSGLFDSLSVHKIPANNLITKINGSYSVGPLSGFSSVPTGPWYSYFKMYYFYQFPKDLEEGFKFYHTKFNPLVFQLKFETIFDFELHGYGNKAINFSLNKSLSAPIWSNDSSCIIVCTNWFSDNGSATAEYQVFFEMSKYKS